MGDIWRSATIKCTLDSRLFVLPESQNVSPCSSAASKISRILALYFVLHATVQWLSFPSPSPSVAGRNWRYTSGPCECSDCGGEGRASAKCSKIVENEGKAANIIWFGVRICCVAQLGGWSSGMPCANKSQGYWPANPYSSGVLPTAYTTVQELSCPNSSPSLAGRNWRATSGPCECSDCGVVGVARAAHRRSVARS